MLVRISVAGDADRAELESLDDWLRGDNELAGLITVAGVPPRMGELGVPAEALVVAVGSGGALSVLASSLKAWITLPRRSDIRIKVQNGDGRVVEIDARRVGEERLDELVRRVLGPAAADE